MLMYVIAEWIHYFSLNRVLDFSLSLLISFPDSFPPVGRELVKLTSGVWELFDSLKELISIDDEMSVPLSRPS